MTPATSLSALERRSDCGGPDISTLRELFDDPSLQTPVMLLSRGEVGRNFQSLKQALPRARIHYAVKPNNQITILNEVAAQGGGFDVCSAGEIEVVRRTGADPSELVYSHPVKSTAEFDLAVAAGVRTFVVDNLSEVAKLDRYRDRPLRILVRYRINTNTQAVVNLQYKFGCLPEEVLPLADAVKEAGHEMYGLCFHVGSQCLLPDNHVAAVHVARDLIHALDLAGHDSRLLDIGGGFPVEYAEPVPSIDDFCAPIGRALDRNIRPGIQIVSEPGRFIAATPVTLVTAIVGKAVRDGKIWYYLDDGLYSTFSGIVYDQCQYPVITSPEGDERLSVLAGPTCDSFDVMYDGLMLPEHNVGDRIVFLATGAYCAVSGSNFNSLRRPEYLMVE
ncbi:MAG: type III PLP-dependent enzyme [bacterium]